MTRATLSVLVPTYRRQADLQRCLEALSQQRRKADEILVVVRETDSESQQVVHQFEQFLPGLRMIQVREPGVIAALNEGMEKSSGDIIVFTDDDSEPLPDWLERLENWFKELDIGAVGGRDWLHEPTLPHLRDPRPTNDIGQLTWYGRLSGNHQYPACTNPLEVVVTKGVNMAIRREALGSRRIDTRLRGQGAQVGWELDLCLYLRSRGWRIIYDDKAIVKHFPATRGAGDVRTHHAGETGKTTAFNMMYLAASYWNPLRVFGALSFRVLVGSRFAPGVVAVAKWILMGDFTVVRRFLSQLPFVLRGAREGWKSRESRK